MEENSFKGETLSLTREKREIPTEINASKIFYKGKPAIITVARDITKRKQHENELFLAKEKAEESDNLKSSFLANLSHEIRTPLNAILGFSELLNANSLEADKRQLFIDTIKESGNKLLSVINDILDISFIESGQVQLDTQKFSLNSMIDDLWDKTRRTIDHTGKNIELKVNKYFADGEDYFVSDPAKIQQIYYKLLNNALKFTKTGYIEFGYDYSGEGHFNFYVKDTGIGVPGKSKSVVFERFRQLEGGMTRGFEGLGLGLSIARGLIHQLGGSIDLDSRVNEGTTITFQLPYQPDERHSPKKEQAVFTNNVARKKILVAEDDLTNFLLVKEILIDAGNEIIHAEDGEKAVKICEKSDDIDLVLMDIKMPVMDGVEALSKIKASNPGIPVIALTAYAFENDKNKLLDEGFDGYLSKPIDQHELIQAIDEVVGTLSNDS